MVLTAIYMVHKEVHGAKVEIDIEEVRRVPAGDTRKRSDADEARPVRGGGPVLTRPSGRTAGRVADGHQGEALEEDRRAHRVAEAPRHRRRAAVDGR